MRSRVTEEMFLEDKTGTNLTKPKILDIWILTMHYTFSGWFILSI